MNKFLYTNLQNSDDARAFKLLRREINEIFDSELRTIIINNFETICSCR